MSDTRMVPTGRTADGMYSVKYDHIELDVDKDTGRRFHSSAEISSSASEDVEQPNGSNNEPSVTSAKLRGFSNNESY